MAKLLVGAGLPPYAEADEIGRIVESAVEVEEHGLDHVSFPDVQLGDGSPTLDPLLLAAAVAARTSTVRLEFSVLAAPLRPPAMLAAQIATLQHLSGGRVVLGVGIGGFPQSPFWRSVRARPGHRVADLLTVTDTVAPLVRGKRTGIGGVEVMLAPSAPAPSVLIGGHNAASVSRAAEHADGWFPSLRAPQTLRPMIAELRRLAVGHGRPRPLVHVGQHAALGPDAAERVAEHRAMLRDLFGLTGIELEVLPLVGPAERLAEQFAEYADAGVDSLTLFPTGADRPGQLATMVRARDLLG